MADTEEGNDAPSCSLARSEFVIRIFQVAVVASLALLATPVDADTVTLNNGAAIDGIVTGRHEGFVILTIGNVGTMKIPEGEVKKIEKNPRTGYLDPNKGRKKVKKLPEPVKVEKSSVEPGSKDDPEAKPEESAEVSRGEALDPAVAKVIKELAHDLTQQRSSKRTRAERRLGDFGDAAVPELVKLAQHPFDRTRIAVFRLLKKSKDSRVIDPALQGLNDEDKFVRKLAWDVLRNLSGRAFPFPWDSESNAKRQKARKQWVKWAEKRQEQEASEAEEAPLPDPKGRKKSLGSPSG